MFHVPLDIIVYDDIEPQICLVILMKQLWVICAEPVGALPLDG
jgi:hypothetical protein